MKTMTTPRSVIGYDAILYHDEPEAVAADSRGLGQAFLTEGEAVKAIRHQLGDHWQTGTVHKGEWFSAIPGQSPAYFESDDNALPLIVGPDWIDR